MYRNIYKRIFKKKLFLIISKIFIKLINFYDYIKYNY